MQSFLITLREGLEIALIVGIVLTYLAKSGGAAYFKSVWVGVAIGLAVSVGVGAIVFIVSGELSGRAEEVFEGIAMLSAVAILTWMVAWMKRQARHIRTHLEARVKEAVRTGSALALALLAFVVTLREGLETVLFLFSAVQTSTPVQSTVGGVIGVAMAVAVGYIFFRGSRRVNLRVLFNVTGVLLILFAAGLLARGIHELQEGGVFPIIVEHVWDMNDILDDKAGVGNFLRGLLGYNGNPALIEVIVYPLYLGGALLFFFGVPGLRRRALAEERPSGRVS